MSFEAKIIAHSIGEAEIPLLTYELRYPKFIHGEAKTHRRLRVASATFDELEEVGLMDDPALSRNASSSRAIPVERVIEEVMTDPAVPVSWGANRPGMQALEEHFASVEIELPGASVPLSLGREEAWLHARDAAVKVARAFADAGYHKQIVNRLLEPWCHIRVVASATDWSNFFALRRHEAAQPEMKMLADLMWDARARSTPLFVAKGRWHLPYFDQTVDTDLLPEKPADFATPRPASRALWLELCARQMSAARCARVTGLRRDGGRTSYDEDVQLYRRLSSAQPMHASPFEHQATPDVRGKFGDWRHPDKHGNFTGWIQHRHTLDDESVKETWSQ